jgi:hypothetical protein
MIKAITIIRTGLATTGLIGAGVGIGVVFGALILLGNISKLFNRQSIKMIKAITKIN